MAADDALSLCFPTARNGFNIDPTSLLSKLNYCRRKYKAVSSITFDEENHILRLVFFVEVESQTGTYNYNERNGKVTIVMGVH